jgi:hypothetical protein
MPTTRVGGPFLGLNKARDPAMLLPGEAQDSLNVSLRTGFVAKRPGWYAVLDLLGEPVLGGEDYLRVNTDTGAVEPIQLVKAGPNLYAVTNGSGVSLSVGMSSAGLLSVAIVNNKAYFCDGSVFKVTDATSSSAVYDAAITRPEAPTAAAAISAGVLRGNFDYKVSFYSSTWGQESAASDASAIVTPDGKKVTITLPDFSPDARVTNRRIWRRNVDALETDWYFVADADNINTTTTYTDDMLDADLNKQRRAPLSYDSTIPAFRYLAYQADVLFAAGADKSPTRLYYSRASEPWTLDQYIEVGSAADTDPITGLAAFQGNLVVFKERSIWILSGNDDASFFLRKVVPGLGCKGAHSIVPMGDYLLFLSEDDFYMFDGSSVGNLSKAVSQSPVGPVIRARNYTRDRYVVGAYDPEEGVVMWTFSGSSSSVNDLTLAFFWDHTQASMHPSWCLWTWGAEKVSWVGRLTDYTTRDRRVHVGTAGGLLGRMGGDSDNGAAIEWRWQTGNFDADDPMHQKEWGELAVDFAVEASAANVLVEAFLNNSATPSNIGTHNISTATFRRRVRRSSREISLRFSGSSSEPCIFNGYTLEYSKCKRT